MRIGQTLGAAARELSQAVRALRRTRSYSVTAVAVIAFSIALATTVFAIIDDALFKPLPYPEADRLFVVHATIGTATRFAFNAEEIREWQVAVPEARFAGYSTSEEAMLERVNEPGLGSALVESHFFEVIGMRPLAGGFSASDASSPPGETPVVISYQLWQNRFGGDLSILGRRIDVSPPYGLRLVGVMSRDFVFPAPTAAHVVGLASGHGSLQVIARMRDDADPELVRQRLEAVMANQAEQRARMRGIQPQVPRPHLRPLGLTMAGAAVVRDELVPGNEVRAMRAAFAAVSALVLLACLNMSGLMATRAADRGREMAVRRAIGARGRDLARVVVAENFVLLTVGSIAGWFVAGPLLGLVTALLPPTRSLVTPTLDWRAAAFAGIAMVICLACVSGWPVLQALRARSHAIGGGPLHATSRVLSTGRFMAIAGQIGLALTLVICSLLFAGSVLKVRRNDLGIRAENLGLVEVRVGRTRAADTATQVTGGLQAFLERIRSLPGVVAAGAADTWVFTGGVAGRRMDVTPIDGQGSRKGRTFVVPIPVTSGFFAAAGLRVIAGRVPTDADLDAAAPLVVVSAAAAAAYWPDTPALGREVKVNRRRATVIGIVADARYGTWDTPPVPAVYAPFDPADGARSNPVVFVRTAGSVTPVVAEIGRWSDVGNTPVRIRRAAPAGEVLANSIRERRFLSWTFGLFAVGALGIVGVGLFGLVAMTVARRTREVGIRMALGASPRRIVGGLMIEQLWVVSLGLAAGFLLTAWAVRMIQSGLYGITGHDARIWTTAGILVVMTGVLAALIPGLRASRIDPVKALRVE